MDDRVSAAFLTQSYSDLPAPTGLLHETHVVPGIRLMSTRSADASLLNFHVFVARLGTDQHCTRTQLECGGWA